MPVKKTPYDLRNDWYREQQRLQNMANLATLQQVAYDTALAATNAKRPKNA